ncbi:hypothetical protein [Ewingella americana]|uniref:Uncharacterized protein n=1 Tax=Ewingella americana TaxID=41202 RepID=A0A502GEA6_9GAMM|nr:hypothetical protein [Ewingella americana]TPG60071.1 hypothetical protein EAH77_16010 [Ewingella americana]
MVKFYVKDLTLTLEVNAKDISTDYIALEYSGDNATLKMLKNWTVAFNLPLNASTVSAIELIRSFVGDVIVTCTEETMIDHKYAAYLASKNVSIITPYGTDFHKNVEYLKEVVGFNADIVVDHQFKFTGFALALAPTMYQDSTYTVIETEMASRLSFVNNFVKAPSLHLNTLADINGDAKEWRSALLECLCYYVYWHKQKWENKAYRWDSSQDTWI